MHVMGDKCFAGELCDDQALILCSGRHQQFVIIAQGHQACGSTGTRSLRTKYISMLHTKKLSRLNMCALKNRKTQKLNFTELNNIHREEGYTS
jgi:hypothetical protein